MLVEAFRSKRARFAAVVTSVALVAAAASATIRDPVQTPSVSTQDQSIAAPHKSSDSPFPDDFPEMMKRELLADVEADPDAAGPTAMMGKGDAAEIMASPNGHDALDICRARRSMMFGYVSRWGTISSQDKQALEISSSAWGNSTGNCAITFQKARESARARGEGNMDIDYARMIPADFPALGRREMAAYMVADPSPSARTAVMGMQEATAVFADLQNHTVLEMCRARRTLWASMLLAWYTQDAVGRNRLRESVSEWPDVSDGCSLALRDGRR